MDFFHLYPYAPPKAITTTQLITMAEKLQQVSDIFNQLCTEVDLTKKSYQGMYLDCGSLQVNDLDH